MATLQQNYQNTLLTIIPDEVVILSETEAVGGTLKSLALCGKPAEGWAGLGSRGGEGGARGRTPDRPCHLPAMGLVCQPPFTAPHPTPHT